MTDEQFKDVTDKLDSIINAILPSIRLDTDTTLKQLIDIKWLLEHQRKEIDNLKKQISKLTNNGE